MKNEKESIEKREDVKKRILKLLQNRKEYTEKERVCFIVGYLHCLRDNDLMSLYDVFDLLWRIN